MELSHFLNGASLLSLAGALITLWVAVYAAKKDRYPTKYVVALVAAALCSMGGFAWAAAQASFYQEYLVGGDSYVYLKFEDLGEDQSKFVLHHSSTLGHSGDFPVYDVAITLIDALKAKGRKIKDPAEIQSISQALEKAVLTKDMATSWRNDSHPTTCEAFYVALIHGRNRSVVQVMQLAKVGGRWLYASRIHEYRESQELPVIHEDIEQHYPRDDEGSVPWLTVRFSETAAFKPKWPVPRECPF